MLTEIQKAIEELAPKKKRNFASGSTNMILNWKGSGLRLPRNDSAGFKLANGRLG
jgi:hypothetical protein